MKRSKTATLILMGLSPLLLNACNDGPPQGSAQLSQQNFTTVADCEKSGVPQASCQKASDDAQADALKSSPHFSTHEACVEQYGADECHQRSDSGGTSFWGPALTGFLIGRMMSGSNNSYYPAGPTFRQTNGSYYASSGGVYGGAYASGASGWRSTSAASGGDTSAAGTRAITASRGGFGSSSAAAGSWGG